MMAPQRGRTPGASAAAAGGRRPLLGRCLELGRSLEPHPSPALSHWSQASGLRISLFQRHDQFLNEKLPDELFF